MAASVRCVLTPGVDRELRINDIMKTNGASKIDMHRPSFLHRSRSHMHEIRSGFVNTFQARSESPGQSDMISSTKRIEEETQPKYHPDHFLSCEVG